MLIKLFQIKEANLTGRPTTLEYERSFQPRFGPLRP